MLFWVRPVSIQVVGTKSWQQPRPTREERHPLQSSLCLFVLVLKTRRPASLAILRGGGQHRILPFFWGGGDVFMTG